MVDKDLTAVLLADGLDCDCMLLLTDVPCAYTHWEPLPYHASGAIGTVTASQARGLLASGCFGVGSMAPKVQAACLFVELEDARRGGAKGEQQRPRMAIITALENAGAALLCGGTDPSGTTGTRVVADGS